LEITSIIGAISGVASLIGLVYLIGVWKGKVDSNLTRANDLLSKYPPQEFALMTKTLWDIYVVDALRSRPDLADHHSAFKLKKEGEDLIPDDIKQDLDKLHNPEVNDESLASGWLVVKFLGMERVSQMAEAKGLSVQEAIAILSTYLSDKRSQL